MTENPDLPVIAAVNAEAVEEKYEYWQSSIGDSSVKFYCNIRKNICLNDIYEAVCNAEWYAAIVVDIDIRVPNRELIE